MRSPELSATVVIRGPKPVFTSLRAYVLLQLWSFLHLYRHQNLTNNTKPTRTKMAKVQHLTGPALLGLLNPRSAYYMGYAWLLGMCEYLWSLLSDRATQLMLRHYSDLGDIHRRVHCVESSPCVLHTRSYHNADGLDVIARQMFGTLQHSTFPVYFKLSITLASGLLGAWIYGHPKVVDQLAEPTIVDVAQVYTLGVVLVAQSANQFVVGPLTSKYVDFVR